ncbi:hypothetical protein HYALB_00014011 [Hymenoscyphus albidus]|uniref:Uncharacterized protein n=1 Tax=Hymenoscyphus albidus TaxID=595503 RepID=A0A9N9Q6V0_9HELO|nr:hypothetical protein HYALB_00014011 [Hymenoscyphus albidus]
MAEPIEPPRELSKKDLTKFVTEHIDKYEQMLDDDEVLWATFQEDFESWDEDHFITANKSQVIKLRKVLRRRGVWIEMDSKKAHMATALVNTLKEVDPVEWTEQEILAIIKNGDTNSTRFDRRHETMYDPSFQYRDPLQPQSTPPAQLPAQLSTQLPAQLPTQLPTQITPQSTTQGISQATQLSSQPQGTSNPPDPAPLGTNTVQQPQGIQAYGTPPGTAQLNQRTNLPTSYQFQQPQTDTNPFQTQQRSTIPPSPPPPPVPLVPPASPVQPWQSTLTQLQAKPGYGRELTNLAKTYTDDMKYGGTGDNFGLKNTTFSREDFLRNSSISLHQSIAARISTTTPSS